MSFKNLQEKVAILLNDIETMDKEDSIRRVVAFVENELEWKNSNYLIDMHDVVRIKSMAVSTMQDFPVNKIRELGLETPYGINHEAVRSICWIDSVILFLRSKQMIPFTVSYHKKGK